MVSTTFSSLLTICSLLSLFALVNSIPDHDLWLPSLDNLPKARGEQLIRELNLFPKQSANVGGIDDVSDEKLVEKKLNLNVGGDSGSNSSVAELGHHAGYFRLPHTKASRLFYFFFESRSKKEDPVVIWLTGGPGCGSELALFYENGPYKIEKNLSLVWNQYGWDKVSNILYVDQPVGTGFSYSTDVDDDRHDETGVSNDLYDFMQQFFAKHPSYAKNDFYITGESYAGHYIPAFAARVNQGNKAKEGIHINLKGIAIGNGFTNPEIQYQAYTDYAYDRGLITAADRRKINRAPPTCVQMIQACGVDGRRENCISAFLVCDMLFREILKIAGDVNYYDITKKCEGEVCYDFSDMEKFLELKHVKDALGVGDRSYFVSCDNRVYADMMQDFMRNLEVGIPGLLEDGINMLVYAGENDLICNWLGNSRWVHAMEWSGQKAFAAAREAPLLVDGKEAGELKSHGPLIFLKVYDSGHMVPMDQPKASLHMLQSWMQGKLANNEKKGGNAPVL